MRRLSDVDNDGRAHDDALEQPSDLSFVITSMINLSAKPGPLFGAVNPAAVGDSGQSDGGVTAAAAAYNTCCLDPRIEASSILTGGAFGCEACVAWLAASRSSVTS